MFSQLKRNWQSFKEEPPGERFQKRYYRRRQKRGHRSLLKKMLLMLAGAGVISVGIILLFIPGPGWLIIFTGAAILAGESLWMARIIDFVEVKLRKLVKAKNSKPLTKKK